MLSKEYLNDKRMSQSKLKPILDGVEFFKYNLENPPEPSESQNLGSAVHVLILEPERSDVIVKIPKINGQTREGKIFKLLMEGKGPDFFPVTTKTKKQEKGIFYEVDTEEKEFIFKMGEKYGRIFTNPENYLILSEEDYEKAHKMAEALWKNEDAAFIVNSSEYFENTHHFNHMDINFKCQLDGHGEDFILDLKTTSILNIDNLIRKEIRNRRYHFQAACYRNVFKDGYGELQDIKYYIIFINSEPPFCVFPVQISYELMLEGFNQFDEACSKYNSCLSNNPEFKPNNRLRMI